MKYDPKQMIVHRVRWYYQNHLHGVSEDEYDGQDSHKHGDDDHGFKDRFQMAALAKPFAWETPGITDPCFGNEGFI